MKKRLLIIASVAATVFLFSCGSNSSESVSAETPVEENAMEEMPSEEMAEEEVEEVKFIQLEEVKGAFTTEELVLEEGTYAFEVTNSGIDHEVAFVLAPAKEDLQQEDWISDAMLTSAISDGQTASSTKPVKLEKGEYVYFCPMNPTPQYKLTVK